MPARQWIKQWWLAYNNDVITPPARTSGVRFVDVSYGSGLFDAVFALGESQSRYLGMLKPAAWRQYAAARTLLAGVADESLLGYVAYRLPRNEVVTAHLVVDPSARGRGIAHLLINELSTRYSARLGLAARCRRDWPANRMWPHLGFVARGDRPGRSIRGHLLTDWWRDHGHTDLLSWAGPIATSVSLVCDANVFIDLHGDQPGAAAERVRYLFNEVLGDRVQLLVTPELRNELNRNGDAKLRSRMLLKAGSYPTLSATPGVVEQARVALVEALGKEPTGERDRSDLMQVAWAAAAQVAAMVTRDNPAIRKLASAAAGFGVRLVSPDEVVVLLDEIESAPSYTPSALLGTGYEVVEAGTRNRDELELFFHHGTGERKRDYVERLRRLAGGRDRGAHRRLYRAPSRGDGATGDAVALLGCEPHDGFLEVAILRMRECTLQATLAAQVAAAVRTIALRYGVRGVALSDPHPHPLMYAALVADGFRITRTGSLAAIAVPGWTTRGLLPGSLDQAVLSPIGQLLGLEDLQTNLPRTATETLNVERLFRPLRIVDAPVPAWLMPIPPAFSAQLFGYPEELFPRLDSLGISIEHVYCRGGRSGESAPGRIYWYVSGLREVVGVSDLIEVVDGDPVALWRQFRRLGVFDQQQVRATANKRTGDVRAIHVMNTQLFERPITLPRLRALAARNGRSLTLRSSSRISGELSADLMREGLGD